MEACDKNHQRKFSLIMALSIFILRCSRRGLVTLSLMASLGLASVMLPVGAAAQSINDETLEKTVIATVNNVPITYGDIALAEDELMGLIGKLPEDKRFEILLGHMIDRILASRAAEESGLDDDPQVLERAAFMKRKAIGCTIIRCSMKIFTILRRGKLVDSRRRTATRSKRHRTATRSKRRRTLRAKSLPWAHMPTFRTRAKLCMSTMNLLNS